MITLPFIDADFEIDERAVTPTRNELVVTERTTFVPRRFVIPQTYLRERRELVLDVYVARDIPQGPMRPDLLQKFAPERLWWLMTYARRERKVF